MGTPMSDFGALMVTGVGLMGSLYMTNMILQNLNTMNRTVNSRSNPTNRYKNLAPPRSARTKSQRSARPKDEYGFGYELSPLPRWKK